jgi:hypothetical protein
VTRSCGFYPPRGNIVDEDRDQGAAGVLAILL